MGTLLVSTGNTGAPSAAVVETIDTTAPSIAINLITGDNSIDPAEAATGFNITGTTDTEVGFGPRLEALLGPRRLGPTIQRQGVAMDELGTVITLSRPVTGTGR